MGFKNSNSNFTVTDSSGANTVFDTANQIPHIVKEHDFFGDITLSKSYLQGTLISNGSTIYNASVTEDITLIASTDLLPTNNMLFTNIYIGSINHGTFNPAIASRTFINCIPVGARMCIDSSIILEVGIIGTEFALFRFVNFYAINLGNNGYKIVCRCKTVTNSASASFATFPEPVDLDYPPAKTVLNNCSINFKLGYI